MENSHSTHFVDIFENNTNTTTTPVGIFDCNPDNYAF